MKRIPYVLLNTAVAFLLLACPYSILGQNVSISETPTTVPDASAMLDIISTNRGLLIPRVQLTATNVASPVTSPAAGLLVYNLLPAGSSPNNVITGFYYWNTKWIPLGKGGWDLTGNAGTVAGTNFLGTTDAVDMVVKTDNTERMRIKSTGNVGIGTSSPNYLLHISGAATNPVSLFQLTNDNTGNASGDGFLIKLASTKNVEFINQEDAALSFYTNGTQKATILNNGNLGVNVISPSQKLDVSGNVQFSQALMPNSQPGSAGQVLISQGANTAPIWGYVGSTWQTATANAQKTLINNSGNFDTSDNGFIQITGLTKQVVTTAASTMLLIFTYGALETTSDYYDGSGTRTRVFYKLNSGTEASIPGAEATIDIEDGSGWVNTIVEFSISTFKVVGPGTHTISIKSKKYADYDDYTAGGSYTGGQDEGSLIIMAIPQ